MDLCPVVILRHHHLLLRRKRLIVLAFVPVLKVKALDGVSKVDAIAKLSKDAVKHAVIVAMHIEDTINVEHVISVLNCLLPNLFSSWIFMG